MEVRCLALLANSLAGSIYQIDECATFASSLPEVSIEANKLLSLSYILPLTPSFFISTVVWFEILFLYKFLENI